MSSCVVVELVVHVVRERGVVSVLLIRALPGEVVLAGVVAHCQAARWVWFNWGQGHKVFRECISCSVQVVRTAPAVTYCFSRACTL